jgi:hypothetical protein
MSHALVDHEVVHGLPLARIVNEHERIDAMALLVGEVGGVVVAAGTVGWLATKWSNLAGFGAFGAPGEINNWPRQKPSS